jgi:hypothetical protein
MDFTKISNYTIEIYFILFYFGQRLYIQRTYFTSDNEADGIDNATRNTFPNLTWIFVF